MTKWLKIKSIETRDTVMKQFDIPVSDNSIVLNFVGILGNLMVCHNQIDVNMVKLFASSMSKLSETTIIAVLEIFNDNYIQNVETDIKL